MRLKSTRILYGVLLTVVLIFALILFSTGFLNPAAGRVLPGVKVMGLDLGNLSKAEGLAKLTGLEKDLRAGVVELNYMDRSWSLPLSETGLDLDEDIIIEEALRYGREGSLVQQWKDRRLLKHESFFINPTISFDQERVKQRTDELTREIAEDPGDASFVIGADDTIRVIPEKNGTKADTDKMMVELTELILEGKEPEIELTMVTVVPNRTTETLHSTGVNGLLGSYSTTFNQGQVSRTYNISVAASAFDEQLIRPGQNVSFNELVGPRSWEAGYRNAPVIVDNELVDGLGGGICQVSSTLYNCVLLAGLEVVERTCHSLPVSYVPLGRDATVVYDALDFVFRNNTDSYLYIRTFTESGRLSVKIYGDTAYKKEVQVNSWVTQEIPPQVVYEDDPNLPKGDEVVKESGAWGFRTSAERLFLNNGVVEKREPLSSSDYSPQRRIIAVGTMEKTLQPIDPADVSAAGNDSGKKPVSGTTDSNSGRVASENADSENSGGDNTVTENTNTNGKKPINQALPIPQNRVDSGNAH